MLAELTRSAPGKHWSKVLFSAKESVYKAWYPLTGRWLGFDEARLTIDPDTATFQARLLVPGDRRDGGPPLTLMTGRFTVQRGLVLTAVVVRRPFAAPGADLRRSSVRAGYEVAPPRYARMVS